ncbi:twin-arginine translocation signal domain-containing protein [Maribacter sp.]|nr:twin-arginine translocation signal domain-containing protein [Maribacter sp.]
MGQNNSRRSFIKRASITSAALGTSPFFIINGYKTVNTFTKNLR